MFHSHLPFGIRSLIIAVPEVSRLNQNDLTPIANYNWDDSVRKFRYFLMCTRLDALVSASGTVYDKIKPFEIMANVLGSLSEVYHLTAMLLVLK